MKRKKTVPAIFPILVFLTMYLQHSVSAQVPNCDGTVPTFSIDFTGTAVGDTFVTPGVSRLGNCCSSIAPEKCIDFIITTDSQTTGLLINITAGAIPPGALYFQLDCGPLTPWGVIMPVSAPGIHYLTFCKPGNNTSIYSVWSMKENISGKVYDDVNSSCSYDSLESELSGIQVNLLDSTSTIAQTTFTDMFGNYYFNVAPGNYTIEIVSAQAANYGYTSSCPLSGQITVSTFPSLHIDFALSCIPGVDLRATLHPYGFRPATLGVLYPFVSNINCTPASGQAKLVIDTSNVTVTGFYTVPDLISGDTLIWNFGNLSNNSYFNIGPVYLVVDTFAVLGDSVRADFFVEPVAGDINPSNNFVHLCKVISNSFDPNEKIVEPQGAGPEGNVLPDTRFTYTIHFQNTGTDTAYDVFVVDTLSSNLDLSTLHLIGASHPYNVTFLSDRVIKFSFYNIMLVDSNVNEPLSHGWISYEIQAKHGLPVATQITNAAAIYFDFNLPVMTNRILNTIDVAASTESSSVFYKNIFLFPNPSTDQFTVLNSQFEIKEINIYDVLGKKVFSQLSIPKHKIIVDVSELNSGIYFVRLKGEKEEQVRKLIKE